VDELITTLLDTLALLLVAAGVGWLLLPAGPGWSLVAAGAVIGGASLFAARPWKRRAGGDGS